MRRFSMDQDLLPTHERKDEAARKDVAIVKKQALVIWGWISLLAGPSLDDHAFLGAYRAGRFAI